MSNFDESGLVILKDLEWLKKQQVAGKCAATVLQTCKKMVEEHIPNLKLLDLESVIDGILEKYNCSATFYGYNGFPSKICISVNEQLVHGIPSDYILKDGDVIKLDFGATYENVIADTAITCIYGPPKSKEHVRLLEICSGALNAAIKSVKVGSRLGVIGRAIYMAIKNSGFGVITKYGGHGISYNKPHAPPFVANKACCDEGIRIKPGLCIAIEPMLVMGLDTTTTVKEDGWTVICRGIAVHVEHTIFVQEHCVEVVTDIIDGINKVVYF
jgi:methionyl aminopeptidase